MTTETKQLTVEKMDDAGNGLARIAILSAVDHDGDTYAKGAFGWKAKGEQWVPILPAHNRSAMPLGKARIFEDGDGAYAELHINLDTAAGRDWHSHLKFDLEKGGAVQEWSYGFRVVDQAKEYREGAEVRVLKKVDVDEVSPVVRGAGVGTRTLSMKSAKSDAPDDDLDDEPTALEEALAMLAAIDTYDEVEGAMTQLGALDG